MDKKTIAIILMALGGSVAIYYLIKNKNSLTGLGAGAADNRGTWAAEDDALYNKMRAKFSVGELNWIDPAVKTLYESGGGQPEDMIKGMASKSGSFARIIYNSAPNEDGQYPPVHWAGQSTRMANISKWKGKIPSLWPASTIDSIYNDFTALKVKYGGL